MSSSVGGEKVLLIGSGGREHALAWKILKSPRVTELTWIPGQTAGLSHLKRLFPEKAISLEFPSAPSASTGDGYAPLAQQAKEAGIDLVVIGPDQALADGATDAFLAEDLSVFGPTKSAAKLEWSKAFAKEVMIAAGVPTAKSFYFSSLSATEAQLKELPWKEGTHESGWVLKADGLALGKGVEVCSSLSQALSAAKRLHEISSTLIIEERLTGPEISLFALCDGESAVVLDSARDYKTLFPQGRGPNTGGMGAVSPVPGLDPNFLERMRSLVFQPILTEMKNRGTPFKGLLYAGLMGDPAPGKKIWVLEFNARFGDPETQALLPRISEDFYPWLKAAAAGKLHELPPQVAFQRESSVFLVAASEGYPDAPVKGDEIYGVPELLMEKEITLFFAGTKQVGDSYFTSGGRVLGTLGVALTRDEARALAHSRMEKIHFRGRQIRGDVGE
jgi:phosphoribosylamine---glycine ligase